MTQADPSLGAGAGSHSHPISLLCADREHHGLTRRYGGQIGSPIAVAWTVDSNPDRVLTQ